MEEKTSTVLKNATLLSLPRKREPRTCPCEGRERLNRGFLFSQETLDSCFRRNDILRLKRTFPADYEDLNEFAMRSALSALPSAFYKICEKISCDY